jgi:hypothetical protein
LLAAGGPEQTCFGYLSVFRIVTQEGAFVQDTRSTPGQKKSQTPRSARRAISARAGYVSDGDGYSGSLQVVFHRVPAPGARKLCFASCGPGRHLRWNRVSWQVEAWRWHDMVAREPSIFRFACPLSLFVSLAWKPLGWMDRHRRVVRMVHCERYSVTNAYLAQLPRTSSSIEKASAVSRPAASKLQHRVTPPGDLCRRVPWRFFGAVAFVHQARLSSNSGRLVLSRTNL